MSEINRKYEQSYNEKTRVISTDELKQAMIEERYKKTVSEVYEALKEKGYNPISQLIGYLLSEDPTYITTHNNARIKMTHLDRDELLKYIIKHYVESKSII